MSTELETAIELAQRGWRVVPLHPIGARGCPCSVPDCEANGKHPRILRWTANASSIRAQIESWWAAWPDSGLGVATGRESEVVVLDVDPRSGGSTSLRRLQAEVPLPRTIRSVTGGGGEHVFFRYPSYISGRVQSSAGALDEGLDIRADGGLIVLPPSPHKSGKRYAWAVGLRPDQVGLEPIPTALLERLRAAGSKPAPRSLRPDRRGDLILPGRRHTTLVQRVGAMHRAGWSNRAIRAALEAENAEACRPSLPDTEIAGIASSAARWPQPWLLDRLELVDHPQVDALGRLVLLGLVEHCDARGETFVGVRKLGEEFSLNKDTIADRVRLLIDLGLVEVVPSAARKRILRVNPTSRAAGIRHNNTNNRSYVRPGRTKGRA